MRLVIEVAAEDYEAVLAADEIVGTFSVLEVRQDGGLLSDQRRVLLVEGLGAAVLQEHGLESGPAMRVWLAPREEQ